MMSAGLCLIKTFSLKFFRETNPEGSCKISKARAKFRFADWTKLTHVIARALNLFFTF